MESPHFASAGACGRCGRRGRDLVASRNRADRGKSFVARRGRGGSPGRPDRGASQGSGEAVDPAYHSRPRLRSCRAGSGIGRTAGGERTRGSAGTTGVAVVWVVAVRGNRSLAARKGNAADPEGRIPALFCSGPAPLGKGLHLSGACGGKPARGRL